MNYDELRNDRNAYLGNLNELYEDCYSKLKEVENKEIMEDFDKLLARIKAYRRHKDADSIVDEMVDEHAKSLGWCCEKEESKEQKVSLEDIFKGIVGTLEKEKVVVSETPVDMFNRIWASLQEQELDDSNKDKKEEVKEEPKAYILVDDKNNMYHVIMDKELLPDILTAYQNAFPDVKFKWKDINRSQNFGMSAQKLYFKALEERECSNLLSSDLLSKLGII